MAFPDRFMFPASRLRGDLPYQRGLIAADWGQVADNFDELAFGDLVIAIADKMSFEKWLESSMVANIIDGKQRWYGASQLPQGRGPQLSELPGLWIPGCSPREQAALFRKYDNRRSLKAYDKFRARLFEQDPAALSLQLALSETPFIFYDDQNPQPGRSQKSPIVLKSVTSIEEAFGIDGTGAALVEALLVHHDAFPDVQPRGDYIVGLTRVMARYLRTEEYNRGAFSERLRTARWKDKYGYRAITSSVSERRGEAVGHGGGSYGDWEGAVGDLLAVRQTEAIESVLQSKVETLRERHSQTSA